MARAKETFFDIVLTYCIVCICWVNVIVTTETKVMEVINAGVFKTSNLINRLVASDLVVVEAQLDHNCHINEQLL